MQEESVTFKGDEKLPAAFCDLETPYQFFSYFFDEDLLKTIVEQSNLFSVQSAPNHPVCLQETDVKSGQENKTGQNENDLGACANIATRLLHNLPSHLSS
nr:unnamed protein product [Callosobruchus analis]